MMNQRMLQKNKIFKDFSGVSCVKHTALEVTVKKITVKFRDGPLKKLWGGGWGFFDEFVLGCSMNIF